METSEITQPSNGTPKEKNLPIKKYIVLIFDLDGVLNDERNNKENHFPKIKTSLEAIHASGDYILMLASFNARAWQILKKWGIHHLFIGVRARANHRWHISPLYPVMSFRKPVFKDHFFGPWVSKATQIHSLLSNELFFFLAPDSYSSHRKEVHQIYFFDDVHENIQEVQKTHPSIQCVLVDDNEGFHLGLLPLLL